MADNDLLEMNEVPAGVLVASYADLIIPLGHVNEGAIVTVHPIKGVGF